VCVRARASIKLAALANGRVAINSVRTAPQRQSSGAYSGDPSPKMHRQSWARTTAVIPKATPIPVSIQQLARSESSRGSSTTRDGPKKVAFSPICSHVFTVVQPREPQLSLVYIYHPSFSCVQKRNVYTKFYPGHTSSHFC